MILQVHEGIGKGQRVRIRDQLLNAYCRLDNRVAQIVDPKKVNAPYGVEATTGGTCKRLCLFKMKTPKPYDI